jgi:hypothetical protein
MPQFDFFTFFIQFFFTTIAALFFYLIYLNILLKQFFFSIRFRQKINAYILTLNHKIKSQRVFAILLNKLF